MVSVQQTWKWFFVTEIAAVLGSLAFIFLLERLFWADASDAFRSTLQIISGFTTGMVAVGIGAWFARSMVQAVTDENAGWFRFLDNMPVAIFALNAKGNPAYANHAAVDMLGKGIVSDATASDLSTVYPTYRAGTDEIFPSEELPIVQALDGGKEAFSDQLELEKDGRRIPLDVWAGPIRDAEGQLEYAVAVFFDTTDRHRLQDEHDTRIRQEQQYKEAERFRELHQQFINHAAHQLYTPLTPLRLQVDSLKGQIDDKTHERLIRNMDRLRVLASQILRVAKTQQLEGAGVFKEASLQAVFDRALDMSVDSITENNITMETGETSIILRCDVALLAEAIYHGIHNAIKFSDQGQTVTLDGRQDGSDVIIEITDDGGGITGDEDLFKPFVQGDADQVQHGWGLGLYLAKVAVDRHQGAIELVPDDDGKGAALRITIPKDGPTDGLGMEPSGTNGPVYASSQSTQ